MAKRLDFIGVTKRFGQSMAVQNVSFSIESGHFFSILGPSGCGKTTLLRMLAGFETPDKGKILLDGVDITRLPPHKRPINTVFQSYALFPHLTVYENIAFGLNIQKKPKKIIEKEVAAMLELIQMEEHAHKKPEQISGGQKQRVAIARALVVKPKVLLLDEPLAALDLKLRQKMLLELDLFHDQVGITFVYVTHDQEEAMAVSDGICVMNKGRPEQVGTPRELYETPTSSFVAAFIGDTNFLDGVVQEKREGDFSLLSLEGQELVLCYNDIPTHLGQTVHISLRPEKIHISKETPKRGPMYNVLHVVVEDIVYKGDHSKYWVKTEGGIRLAVVEHHSRFLEDERTISWGDEVYIYWHADDAYMIARFDKDDGHLTELPHMKIGEDDEEER